MKLAPTAPVGLTGFASRRAAHYLTKNQTNKTIFEHVVPPPPQKHKLPSSKPETQQVARYLVFFWMFFFLDDFVFAVEPEGSQRQTFEKYFLR